MSTLQLPVGGDKRRNERCVAMLLTSGESTRDPQERMPIRKHVNVKMVFDCA